MIRSDIATGLKLALLMALGLLSVAGPGEIRADDKIDKKVVEIIKETGDFYKKAKSFHVEGTFVTKGDDDKGVINVSAVFDIERPNRLSLKTRVDGDSKKGPDIVADGQKLTVLAKSLKQYVQEDSPQNLGEIGLKMLQVGPALTGMLFANVLAEEPSDLLMQGVTFCSYAGKDKVDGKPVHRMKFSQEEFDWELWVAAEGKPFVLRMIRVAQGANGKITTTETYKNWKVDPVIAKEAFHFTAPEGASKVDEFKKEPTKD
jgi:hypothetical protein